MATYPLRTSQWQGRRLSFEDGRCLALVRDWKSSPLSWSEDNLSAMKGYGGVRVESYRSWGDIHTVGVAEIYIAQLLKTLISRARAHIESEQEPRSFYVVHKVPVGEGWHEEIYYRPDELDTPRRLEDNIGYVLAKLTDKEPIKERDVLSPCEDKVFLRYLAETEELELGSYDQLYQTSAPQGVVDMEMRLKATERWLMKAVDTVTKEELSTHYPYHCKACKEKGIVSSDGLCSSPTEHKGEQTIQILPLKEYTLMLESPTLRCPRSEERV